MKFWDSSAVVTLLVQDVPASLDPLRAEGDRFAMWWGSRVECHSALRRRARAGQVAPTELPGWIDDIDRLAETAIEIAPSEPLRSLACELVNRHPLRAGDALQLAAAVTARAEEGEPIDFVCLDLRLRQAAEREGFAVLPA